VTAQIPNLLYCFLPRETQEEPDVLEDKAAMFEAWKSLYNWLMLRMVSGLSAYSGGASRVRGPIRLTGFLNDIACDFCLARLSLERRIVMAGWSGSGEMFF
jgi:hypothetical protein